MTRARLRMKAYVSFKIHAICATHSDNLNVYNAIQRRFEHDNFIIYFTLFSKLSSDDISKIDHTKSTLVRVRSNKYIR